MDILLSETRINLARSFAGEAQARGRYTAYAAQARQEGLEWIARIFEETADNEAVHAQALLLRMRQLGGCGETVALSGGYPFQLGTTAENLRFAAAGEEAEHAEVYPGFAEMARREGFDDAARLWMQLARVEGSHHLRFSALAEQMAAGVLTQKPEPVRWRCLHCGYVYEGKRACDPCPVCGKGSGWQEGVVPEKAMMEKP